MAFLEIDTDAIEELLGYSFCDKSLLAAAFTHQTYANFKAGVSDNQRLEFLGDAVIGLFTAEYLYLTAPSRDEGYLTIERSRIVSGKALAEIAAIEGWAHYMRFSAGVKNPNERLGQRTQAALCEAILGALWLDGGRSAVEPLFNRLFVPRIQKLLEDGVEHLDPRGELQNYSRNAGFGEPVYETLGEEGDGSHFTFTVSVKVGDKEQIATGSSKKRAYAAAAEAFLRRLQTEES